MKRIKCLVCVLAALILALSLTGALAAQYTANAVFTITYDDAAFTLDDTSFLTDAADDTFRWLFLLIGGDLNIDASMESWEEYGYAGVSLQDATEGERQEYISEVLDSFGDAEATFLTAMEAGSEKVPFFLFRVDGEGGGYVLAETLVSGYSIDFYAYYQENERAADDALANQLAALLSSFTPIKAVADAPQA